MQEPFASPDASSALLVLDAAHDEPPRLFRSTTTAQPLPTGIDAAGFSHLRCSGSAQFSAHGWDEIRAHLGDPPDLHVVDLRQESHGFLNGHAVSWYAKMDWGSVRLAHEDALALEALRLKILDNSDEIRVGDASDIKKGRPPTFLLWKRHSVAAERDLLGLPEGRYLRLTVTDHLRPRDEVVDAFVTFARSLRGRPHLHFHCRGGKGRTATFMALYDMLHNAHRVAYEAILVRQRLFGGYDLASLPADDSPKRPFIAERAAFLRQFYDFARESSGAWTAWLTTRAQRAP